MNKTNKKDNKLTRAQEERFLIASSKALGKYVVLDKDNGSYFKDGDVYKIMKELKKHIASELSLENNHE